MEVCFYNDNPKYFSCSGLLLEVKLCPLENYYAPLAAGSELPILAGDTLYPSADHFIAAQLFRDINRLDAAKDVPKINYGKDLRRYIRSVVSGCDESVIVDWRRTKMFHSLKVATQLKFAQYPELKALLIQTGYKILLDTTRDDFDWGIGMKYDDLQPWLKSQDLSPLAVIFWTLHSDYKPGVLGDNLNGKLLMIIRKEFMIEAGIDFKLDPKTTFICTVCSSQFNNFSNSIDQVSDEIMLINGPNCFIAFDFPALILTDARFYENIDEYIVEKCKETDMRMLPTHYLLQIIEIGLNAAYQQNHLLRNSLLKTGNALLVDVRDNGKDKSDNVIREENVRQFALDFIAFFGNYKEFCAYVEQMALTPQILKRSWTLDTFRLKYIGRNRIGIILMDIRKKLISGTFNIRSTDEMLKTFTPRWLTEYLDNPENFYSINTLTLHDTLKRVDDKKNPLSRFYHASFELFGECFLSVEHYFWWKKMQNVAPRRFLNKLLNNRSSSLRTMCELWLASNTPVEDEERDVSEMQILLDGTTAKFAQNPALCCYLLNDLFVLVDGNRKEMTSLNHYVKKYGIKPKLLVCWWFDKFEVKPAWLCDNAYGLILMKVRQNFVDSRLNIDKRPLLNVDDKCRIEETDSAFKKYYVISDESADSCLSKLTSFSDSDVSMNSVEYASVYHLYWSSCLKQLGLEKEAESLLTTVADGFDCIRFVDLSTRLMNKLDDFTRWLHANEHLTLLEAFKAYIKSNGSIRDELLATQDESAVLIFCSENAKYGVGMKFTKFFQFINDLGINPHLFNVICSPTSIFKPDSIGENLWGQHLSLARQHCCCFNENEVAASCAEDGTVNSTLVAALKGTFIESENIVYQESSINFGTADDEKANDSESDHKAESKAVSWHELYKLVYCHRIDAAEAKPEKEEKLESETEFNPTYPDDSELDGQHLALMTAFRQCGLAFIDLLNQCQNKRDAFQYGRQLAAGFYSLFSDRFESAANGFSAEDLHNIGRVAGFEEL